MSASVALGAVAAAKAANDAIFKQKKSIDIGSQLGSIQQNASRNSFLNENLHNDLAGVNTANQTDTASALEKARADAETQKSQYLGDTAKLTDEAKNALRANLYSKEFSGLPDALKAVREASAAGSGINSGAYQSAVAGVGADVARNLTTGERDIQVAGLQNQQQAQNQTYQTFANLTSKLSDQKLEMLTKVLDTGREDLVRRTTVQMGLNDSETQAVVDLLNFKQSGQLASQSAADANQQSLYNALIQTGGTILGKSK